MFIDAVVVLANLMEVNGTLQEESAKRASRAAEVFVETNAGKLVTCGWAYREDSDIAIADAFLEHIVKYHAIPESRITVEKGSRDTVGDAYFTKINHAIPNAWRNVIVVTSNYHVPRTQEIFDFIYGDACHARVTGVETDENEVILENEKKSLEAFRKTFSCVPKGDTQKILERLRSHHPFYNGEIYKKI